MKQAIKSAVLISACVAAGLAAAQEVAVSKAWVRGAVAGQNATGAFMELTAAADSALIGAASPLAKSAEIHEMVMDGNVMKMRAVTKVDLPAGKAVQLAPGGYHIMLMGLSKALNKGDTVPLELTVQGKDQKTSKLRVRAEVRELGAASAMDGHEHHH